MDKRISHLPKVWFGLVLTLILFLVQILDSLQTGQFKGLPSIIASLAVFAYWLFCIYRLHEILAEISDYPYPVPPEKAAAFHLIPVFNLYWMFKWPKEMGRFLNGSGLVHMSSGLGILLLFSFIVMRFDATIGYILLFSVTLYIRKKLAVYIELKQKFL